MMRMRWVVLLLCMVFAGLVFGGCSKRGGSGLAPPAPTRSFHLGFTPFPYDATAAAQTDTWARIQSHGDMVTIHLDSGVPWPEAYAQTAYPAKVEAKLADAAARIASDKIVFLAVSCCDGLRENLCGAWNDTGENQPRPGVWAARTYADVEVADAYIHWMENLITRYDPAYVNYAVEVTELGVKDPAEFVQFQTFAQRVYTALKASHPALPLFVSIILKPPGSAAATTVYNAFQTIQAYVDVVAVSTYAYVFFYAAASGDPANLPVNWLSQARALAPGKPFAVAETGWIADTLDIPAWGTHIPATPADQKAYVEKLLAECDANDALFITWFLITDYDALMAYLPPDPILGLWKDIGFYDETLAPRPALGVWDAWLARGMR